MKTILYLVILSFPVLSKAQNVGIGTITPNTKLEVRDTIKSQLMVSSKSFNDTSQLIFRNRNIANEGTDMILSNNRESGLRITSKSDLLVNVNDSILQITPRGGVGINNTNPQELLDVRGNINLTGTIKVAKDGGADGDVLRSNGNGTMQWDNIASLASATASSGFGVWGDCAVNSIVSAYQPVADTANSSFPQEFFGSSVSISGNFAIVGADFDFNDGGPFGGAFIYQFIGDKWILKQKLAEGTLDRKFGTSVSISGNYAVVGEPEYQLGSSIQGAAIVYHYNGSSWVFMQRLLDPTGAIADDFGQSVCISGNRIIVGAPSDDVSGIFNQGSASIFQLSGNSWVFMQQIIDATGANSDAFGYSVSISGNIVIIGAPFDDNEAFTNQGSASVYRNVTGTWNLSIKTTNPSGRSNVNWGWSVSVSGNSIIIGAPGDIVGTTNNQGTVSFFDFNGANWIYAGKYSEPNRVGSDNFGTSVSISGDYAIVGAYAANIGANSNQGSTTVFFKFGATLWQRLITIIDPAGNVQDNFGNKVALDAQSKRFLIGALGFSNNRGKALFGKIN